MMKKIKFIKRLKRALIVFSISLFLTGCASKINTTNLNNVCDIFEQKPRWYKTAKKSTAKWGGNIQLPMAIIYQESTFNSTARPKRKKILGFIPGSRPSNAYGYAQALKSTWAEYKKETNRHFAKRSRFSDSFDFIQWYINKSQARNNISKWNYRDQYLNYHEGQGGFSRGTHLRKKWLLNTASRVEQRAKNYGQQLLKCSRS